MIITDIKVRRKHLTAIALSENYLPQNARVDSTGLLVLDTDYADELRLKAGLEFTDEQIDALFEESERRRAKSRAFWLLEQQDYPSGKLFEKLKKTFSADAASYATARMCELGLINDEALARRYADSLINLKGVSKRQAPFLIYQKGIDLALAKAVVGEMDGNDRESIEKLLATKYSTKLSNETDIKKIVAALLRKGFSYSDIRAVMDKYSDEFYLNGD